MGMVMIDLTRLVICEILRKYFAYSLKSIQPMADINMLHNQKLLDMFISPSNVFVNQTLCSSDGTSGACNQTLCSSDGTSGACHLIF